MKKITVTILFLLLFSCSAVKVSYDYDKATDFSNYATYNYFSDMHTGLSELDEKRLLNLMDITMQIKGMVNSEEPDFLVNIVSKSIPTPQNTAVGVGVGGTGRNVGGGISLGIPVGGNKLERQIIIDFVDPSKDELFWQAIGTYSIRENSTPIVREQKLTELVDKALSKYPPKSKK